MTTSSQTNRTKIDSPAISAQSVASWDNLIEEKIDLVEKAVRESLKNPIGFPPLETAIIPDDQVCLAVEPGIPQSPRVVAAVVDYLIDHGVLLKNIGVLVSPLDQNAGCFLEAITAVSGRLSELRLSVHDPDNDELVGYLAANSDGGPITFHRELFDADVVIPICLAKADKNQWQSGVEFLYPQFSNRETINRFAEREVQNPGRKKDHPNAVESHEAMRWLGVYLGVHVQPGYGESILKFSSGERKETIAKARSQLHAAWHRELDEPCDLVVASASSESLVSDWSQVCEIVKRFADVIEPQGAIVIAAKFGSRDVDGDAENEEGTAPKAASRISRNLRRQMDSLLEQIHVYLHSDLGREATEELGLGYISKAAEVDRLVNSANRVLHVIEASRCTVSLRESSPTASRGAKHAK